MAFDSNLSFKSVTEGLLSSLLPSLSGEISAFTGVVSSLTGVISAFRPVNQTKSFILHTCLDHVQYQEIHL